MVWMSGTAENYKENGEIDRKKELDTWFNSNSPTDSVKFEVLKSSMVNSVYYGAIKRTEENKPDQVYATICLTKVDRNSISNFHFKEMNEFSCPPEYKCPIGILNLLSETNDKYAKKWREKCRKYHEKNNLIKSLPAYGRKKGKIRFTPSYNLPCGHKKDIPIELYWQPVVCLFTPNPQGYWTDGKYSFSPKLLMTGIVEKI